MAAQSGVHESLSRGKDGKYQIRIESYDPARNTMKAIWLVSRNEKLLSNLLDKCEVSEGGGTSDEDLRGNLLSVQRELQELKEAMSGTQTPVVDASLIASSTQMSELESSSSGGGGGGVLRPTWSSLGMFSSDDKEGLNLSRPASAAPALDFGLAKRKRVFLSQIPLYSRPSIRTDFSIASIDPFPEIRLRPSKIPSAPKPPGKKKKSKKTATQAKPVKTPIACKKTKKKVETNSRTKITSSKGAPQLTKSKKATTRVSKPAPVIRPSTSMALPRTSAGTKKVTFSDTVGEKRTASKSAKTVAPETPDKKTGGRNVTLNKSKVIRPASSIGVRTIPRSSSRLCTVGGVASKRVTGRHSALANPTQSSGSSYMQMYLGSQSSGSKCEHNNASKEVHLHEANVGSDVSKTKKQSRTKSETKASVSSVPNEPPPQVLDYDSPPPVAKLTSSSIQEATSETEPAESAPDEIISSTIRSVSIIDENSDGLTTRESNNAIPRILIGDSDDTEYQVKAYFLDECTPESDFLDTQGSAIIPSSPVEIDEESTQEDQEKTRDVCTHFQNSVGNETILDSEYNTIGASGPSMMMDQTDFGFLAEFEDEVSDLLDSLMTQQFDSTFKTTTTTTTTTAVQSSQEDEFLLSYNSGGGELHDHQMKEQEVTLNALLPPMTPINTLQSAPVDATTLLETTEDQLQTTSDTEADSFVQKIPDGTEDRVVEEVEAVDQTGDIIIQQEDSELAFLERPEPAINSDHQSLVKEAVGASEIDTPVSDTNDEDIKQRRKSKANLECNARRRSTGTSMGKKKGGGNFRRTRSQSGLQCVTESKGQDSTLRNELNLNKHRGTLNK
eukprot:g3250.t1